MQKESLPALGWLSVVCVVHVLVNIAASHPDQFVRCRFPLLLWSTPCGALCRDRTGAVTLEG